MFLENLKYLLSKNDPSFQYETSQSYTVASREQPKWKPREAIHNTMITTNKTDITQSVFEDTKLCPIHGIKHSLNDCRTFRSKSLTERKQFLKENGLCYKCCGTVKHMTKDCRVRTVICGICRSNHHRLDFMTQKQHGTKGQAVWFLKDGEGMAGKIQHPLATFKLTLNNL